MKARDPALYLHSQARGCLTLVSQEYVCVCLCVYVCMHVCMHACMHVCIYMCVCMYVYMCIYIWPVRAR